MEKYLLTSKTWRKFMRITVSQLLLVALFSTVAWAHDSEAQEVLNRSITVVGKHLELRDILSRIEDQAAVKFVYSNKIKVDQRLSLNAKERKLSEVLGEILSPVSIDYEVIENRILLKKGRIKKMGLLPSTKKIESPVFSIVEQTTVQGRILDETGTGLPGVTIQVKGTQQGTVSDANGDFTLSVPDNKVVLLFSFVGYVPQEIPLNGQTTLNVNLQPDTEALSEVLVVGFGTQKKINATGAISSVGTKELVQSPVANISNSLVGRMPGLFATQVGGEPGNDGSRIRIRGVGTFSGNTDPLVMVDGIQVDNYNNIDPNEIESVTILKDASSTAVYGIRGANGVLIITTKRGKTGPPKVSYTYNQGFNTFTDLRETMNSADYATNYNQAQKADAYVTGAVYTPRYSDADIELYRNGQDPIFHPNTNWIDLLFRKWSTQSQHNLTISGGQNKVKFFVSGGYFNQQGLFKDTRDIIETFSPQSTFRRYNIRSNFNFEISRRLKMTLDLSTQTEIRNGHNNSSGGTERVIGDIMRGSPLDGPGVVDGKVVDISLPSNNGYVALLLPNNAGGVRRSYRNYLNGLLRFDYDLGYLTEGLAIHANVALQTYNDQQIVNAKSIIRYMAFRLPDGSVNLVPNSTEAQFSFSQSGTYNRRITAEFGIDYKRSFGNHNVTGLLLYNQQKTYDPGLAFLVPKGYQSFVGRATYDFKGRYLAEVNVGYNGTENFAPGKRFGLFPAYSLGWVASEESFFPKDAFVTLLKFRGSYGEVGNDNIGGTRFLYRPTSYTTFGNIYYFGNVGTNYTGFTGIREGATGNPDVTWERAIKRNLGLELWLWKDKIRFTGDVFDEKRSDILAVPRTISTISGLIQPATNLGKMENKGYELDISFSDKDKSGKFGYRIAANLSFARNKIIFQDEVPNIYPYQNRTGQRFGQNFGLIAEGIYNTWEEVNEPSRPIYQYANNKIQPGDLKYRDVNGDGMVNDFDAVPIGYSNIPEKTFGLTLGGNYKGFDLSILFQGVDNVSLYYSRFQRNANFGENPPASAPIFLNESWTPERYAAGLPINFPRFTISNSPNNVGSSFFLADASYLRIKNLELGYTLSATALKKVGISSCRIYANANNLYTWKKVYPGIDPENANTGDVNTEPYPLVRTMNLGLNVKF